jgi:hypothetical protein
MTARVIDLDEERFGRLCDQLHRRGPRVLREFLAALGAERMITTIIEQKLQRYRHLSPDLLRALMVDDIGAPRRKPAHQIYDSERVDFCRAHADWCSHGERKFLEGLAHQLAGAQELTPKQVAILDRIYLRISGRLIPSP